MDIQKKIKTIVMKVLIFILVWLASMLAIGIIDSYFKLGDKIGTLFSLIVLFAPIGLAVLAVIPRKKISSDSYQTESASEVNNTHPAPTTTEVCTQPETPAAPVALYSMEESKTASNPSSLGKTYRLTGVEYYEENLLNLACENNDYSMSKRELIDCFMTEERIWKYNFYPTKVDLVPEPENPYDPNAIKVIVDGEHVGYIKRGSCKHLLNVIAENRLGHIACSIGGGPYKCLYEDDKEYGEYELETDKIGYYVVLHIQELER